MFPLFCCGCFQYNSLLKNYNYKFCPPYICTLNDSVVNIFSCEATLETAHVCLFVCVCVRPQLAIAMLHMFANIFTQMFQMTLMFTHTFSLMFTHMYTLMITNMLTNMFSPMYTHVSIFFFNFRRCFHMFTHMFTRIYTH